MRSYRAIPIDKAIDSGEFVYGWYCEVGGTQYIIEEPTPMAMNQYGTYLAEEDFIEVNPTTVGQQVGLSDKNGKELNWWEGDLMSIPNSRVIYEILLNKNDGQWSARRANYAGHNPPLQPLYNFVGRGFEIIGNIHSGKKSES